MDDAEAEKFKGEMLNDSHYDFLIDEPCCIFKPDGSPLIKIVRGEINQFAVSNIFASKIKGLPDNRGTSTGKDVLTGQGSNRKRQTKGGHFSNTTRVDKSAFDIISDTNKFFPGANNRGTSSGSKHKNAKTSKGYKSNTNAAHDVKVASGIIGYFDRYPRFPYARETSFLVNYPAEWRKLQPFIHKVNSIFEQNMPDRYAVQKDIVSNISSDWIIGDTVFSTITVNKTYRTACHKDEGDLKEGFGVMAYFETNPLLGGYLVIPAYRVAVKLKHGDVVLFDVHEWHGNTPIKPLTPTSNRITCVFYLRENLLRCGDGKHEINRAKKVRQIGKLYDADEIAKAEIIKQEVLKKHGISYTNPK